MNDSKTAPGSDSQATRFDNGASALLALHQPGRPFVLANAWDRGSARMLVALGAQAVATSSAAHAFTLGKRDLGDVTRDEALRHAEEIAASVPVPVSADFENGYGHEPEVVAETITLAINRGIAGACIEDIAAPTNKTYSATESVARIEAAVDAVRASGSEFVLTARADGVMHGRYDLGEAIRRIKEFERVGADVLFVPVPGTLDDLTKICKAVETPVNALAAGPLTKCSWQDFADAGVARISLGSSLARLTHRVTHDVALEILRDGQFGSLAGGISGDVVEALVVAGGRDADRS